MAAKAASSVEVRVRVATILLRRAVPPLESASFGLEVPGSTDVAGLIGLLGIPVGLVGSVTVNKRRSPLERVLEPGDSVAIVPSISGG